MFSRSAEANAEGAVRIEGLLGENAAQKVIDAAIEANQAQLWRAAAVRSNSAIPHANHICPRQMRCRPDVALIDLQRLYQGS
jgi:hypothetical protein